MTLETQAGPRVSNVLKMLEYLGGGGKEETKTNGRKLEVVLRQEVRARNKVKSSGKCLE